MSTKPNLASTPRNIKHQLTNAHGTALQTIYTAPAGGGRIDSLNVSSTDTSARDIQLYVTIGGIDYLLGTVSIPITAGFIAATPSVNLLASINIPGALLDPYSNKVIILEGAAILKWAAVVTLTAAKTLNLLGMAGEF